MMGISPLAPGLNVVFDHAAKRCQGAEKIGRQVAEFRAVVRDERSPRYGIGHACEGSCPASSEPGILCGVRRPAKSAL